MIIDDTLLIQVYSTVLVGVLIFFTIQRHFEWKEVYDEKTHGLRRKIENAEDEIRGYEERKTGWKSKDKDF